MCYYRYYYFSGCRHQKTVLFAYCDQAEPLRIAPAPSEAERKDAPPPSKSKSKSKGKKKREETERKPEPEKSLPPSSQLTASQHINISISTPKTGAASITEEPVLETSSASSEQILPHSSAYSTDDMAGLASFGTRFRSRVSDNGSFRAPLVTKSNAIVSASYDSSLPYGLTASNQQPDSKSLPHSTRRKPGIRENTDESCILADSSVILQHLAESSRDIHEQHVGTDDRRMTSCGSVVADRHNELVKPEDDTLDQIEADIEALKAEVSRIREKSDNHSDVGEAFLAPAARDSIEQQSAASRLQRAHEKIANVLPATEPESQKTLPPPLSPDDFPVLSADAVGSLKATTSIGIVMDGCSTTRKPSYARAALVGWKEDIERRRHAATSKQAALETNARVSGPRKSGASAYHQESKYTATMPKAVSGELSGFVLASPESTKSDLLIHDTLASSKESSPTRDCRPSKEAPRFAQPTTSFARRKDVTMRKDSTYNASGETSPTKKTVKAGELRLETEKRAAVHQKRKSLPSNWLSAEKTTQPEETGALPSPTNAISPATDGCRSTAIATKAHQTKAKEAAATKSPQQVRKKTSSYMLPTAAATQRTLATLAQENAKHSSPCVRQDKFRIENMNHYAILMSPESTSSSAHGSLPSSALELQFSSPFTSPEIPAKASNDRLRCRDSMTKEATGVASSPLAITSTGMAVESSTSPSKIPRAVAHARVRSNTFSGSSAQDDRTISDALTQVANTTKKRRTSHADILRPIIAKLDHKGLWKDKPDSFNVSAGVDDKASQYEGNRSSEPPVRGRTRKTSVAEQLEEVALLARQGLGIKKVVQPHLKHSRRSSAISSVSAMSAVTGSTIIVTECRELATTREGSAMSTNDTRVDDSASSVSDPFEGSPLQKTTSLPTKPISSSLRATATEFKPIWIPETVAQELRLLSWEGRLDDSPGQVDPAMPEDVKWSVKRIQEWKRAASPSKTAERRFWGDLMHQITGSDVVPRMNEPVVPNGRSSNIVRAGQVLKPTLSPGRNTVQWIMQDPNGEQRPISFGRAPPPSAPPQPEFDTPMVSPHSDDTSPIKTPYTPPAWTIGSAGASQYGWLGGDGKEIKFVGPGVYAETDPNSPVYMHSQSGTNGIGAFGGCSAPRYDSKPTRAWRKTTPRQSSKVWPRSRQQWAELAGHLKVPCGSIEYTQVAEVMPYPIAAVTNCFDCIH